MNFLQKIFQRQKTFPAKPSDLKMWRTVRPHCDCFDLGDDEDKPEVLRELNFHADVQDTESEAWKLLEALIQKAILDKSKNFVPGEEMPAEMWSQIITLPKSIAGLKHAKRLYLYGSHLVRIPPEIGEMTNLVEFDAYTSYRLHWLPYEITRCQKLKRSRMSTRALYGNFKYRPPFPRLSSQMVELNETNANCSVCGIKLDNKLGYQAWISLQVAADVMPLLVNACSKACLQKLPPPAKGYVDHPHQGGLDLQQPPSEEF